MQLKWGRLPARPLSVYSCEAAMGRGLWCAGADCWSWPWSGVWNIDDIARCILLIWPVRRPAEGGGNRTAPSQKWIHWRPSAINGLDAAAVFLSPSVHFPSLWPGIILRTVVIGGGMCAGIERETMGTIGGSPETRGSVWAMIPPREKTYDSQLSLLVQGLHSNHVTWWWLIILIRLQATTKITELFFIDSSRSIVYELIFCVCPIECVRTCPADVYLHPIKLLNSGPRTEVGPINKWRACEFFGRKLASQTGHAFIELLELVYDVILT